MVNAARRPILGMLILLTFAQLGCRATQQSLRNSQLHAWRLYEQNRALAEERDRTAQALATLADEKRKAEERAAALESSLNVAKQRLENLTRERSTLQERYASLLNRAKNQPSPLSDSTRSRFEDLARRYPDFEFDPETGVSKFHADILFDTGSAKIRPEAEPLLREFAEIMNEADADKLNILVVGHTDDRPIARSSTRSKHPTNWHLSTNRANSVVLALSKFGIDPARMGAAGYSMYQPVVPNSDDKNRSLNRRVEIYVLAPDAVVARHDSGSRRE